VKRAIRTTDDLLGMLDRLFTADADRKTEDASGWWEPGVLAVTDAGHSSRAVAEQLRPARPSMTQMSTWDGIPRPDGDEFRWRGLPSRTKP
jgi:hypothetical protein